MRAILLVAILVLPFAGCASKAPPPAPSKVVIGLTDNAFEFATVKARSNELIEWQNRGNNTHRIMPDEFPVGTADIKPGGIGQIKLAVVGHHGVHCAYHPEMKMDIEIVAG